MSGILICAATQDELATFGSLGFATCAVTGVGVPHTLLNLSPLLESVQPALVVNIGIAGAYPVCDPREDASSGSGVAPEFSIGDVVIGISEVFADLGMEIPDGERFRPLGAFPFADDSLRAPFALHVPDWASAIPDLKRGHGATVNTCTGTLATGALRRRLFGTDFETMEGAAVALACRVRNIPVMEVRAISNRAARRDLRSENIRHALGALKSFWDVHRDRIGQP